MLVRDQAAWSWRGADLVGFARRRAALFGLGRSVAGQQEGFQHGERTRCTEGHGAGKNGALRDVLVVAWPGDGIRAELFRYGGVAAPLGRGPRTEPSRDAVGIVRCWAFLWPVRC
jgi:hypothetical protein